VIPFSNMVLPEPFILEDTRKRQMAQGTND
jgi:hypothetical protein